ncbi:MAG TPA: TIGR04282 family arsenosugar biosynthesis glycosyltransferase [Pyrinomonadaceae bacterium]|nr:TIGR04282 family arsenosugar biosynthesis glycosyltransferase [Pyrinomonadaceae bacterium]
MVDSPQEGRGAAAPRPRDASRPEAAAATRGPAVVLMAKAPRAGRVKTRLSPPLSPAECAALARCLFADTAAAALSVVRAVFVAYAPADGRAALEPLLPAGAAVGWLEQRGSGLGERLSSVVERVFALGSGPVLLLGADSPTLPPRYLAAAVEALASGGADAALGPTDDGGYYLVGLRRPAPGLFEGVEWSTPRAYEQTARNAARLSLRLAELPRWYDVDTPADLERLRRELAGDHDARRRAPATLRWLQSLDPARDLAERPEAPD